MNNKTEAEQLKTEFIQKIVKEINSLFHEVQQDSMPLGNEDWKEGYNKALYNILEIINKQ